MELTGAEWKLMKVIWHESPLSVREITERLQAETNWGRHTVISFLNRLIKKEAIAVDETEKVKRYYPLVDREVVAEHETSDFVQRIFDGSISKLVNTLVPADKLSFDEQRQLEALLEALEKGEDS